VKTAKKSPVHHQHHRSARSPSFLHTPGKRKKSKKKRKRPDRRPSAPSSSEEDETAARPSPPSSASRKEAVRLDRSISQQQERSEKKVKLERSLSSGLSIAYTYGLSNDCKPAATQPMKIPKINKIRPDADAQ
jgi:hypothetical protein